MPLREGALDLGEVQARSTEEFRDLIAEHLRADGLEWAGPPSLAVPARPATCVSLVDGGPEVTVIVCTRDRGPQLRETLHSLSTLTYQPLRFLIVDNASRDETTRQVFDREVGTDPRFQYVREDRPGLSCARNRGLLEATTEIVAYTDDDARVDPEWIQGLVRGFKRRPDVACVTGLVPTATLESMPERYFDARLDWAGSFRPRLWHLTERPPGIPSYPYSSGIFGTGANFAVRASVMRALDGFDEALGAGTLPGGGEDLDAFARIVLAGHWLAYEPSAIVWHTHRSSLSSLRRQMYHYGTGMTAYLMKHLYIPEHRADVALLVPRGVWMSRKVSTSTREAVSPTANSARWRLIGAEFSGFVVGPVLYVRARRKRPPRTWAQIDTAASSSRPPLATPSSGSPPGGARPVPGRRLRELAGLAQFWGKVTRDLTGPADLVALLRLRSAGTRFEPLVVPRPATVRLRMKSLRGPLHLRTHSTDFEVFREIFQRGDYDSVSAVVGPSPRLIVDLGANIGLSARWFLARWPDAHVVAVEPEPGNAAVLRANLAGASATVHQVCVGGWERMATLTTSQGEYAFRLTSGEAGRADATSFEAPVRTLESILDEAGAEREIDLLKCDIEGAERELFDSCESWIGRVRNIVVECHDDYTTAELLESLAKNHASFRVAGVVKAGAGTFEVAVLTRAA
ncbi:FkbM family methyltransferase [Pseudofrankia saprophytica]|uniref:FkbM family methyltransferase n=1 Tax=Pseudofrankia saprophytica TaxID=298655 RepID=UPI0003060BA5|nr:FkbM family methyltransferase [Pseudofrankia saprophytica]